MQRFWPQMLLGWGTIVLLAATIPAAIPYALLIAGGLALAAPLAAITADPGVGAACVRMGVGQLPEETTATGLDMLDLPALKAATRPPAAGAARATR